MATSTPDWEMMYRELLDRYFNLLDLVRWTDIEHLDLPFEIVGVLHRERKIYMTGPLLDLTETDLLDTPGIGPRRLETIKGCLSRFALKLKEPHPVP